MTVWIILAIGLGCAVIVAVSAWRRRIDMSELGTVSTQWLTEQRAHDREYPHR